MSKVTQKTLSRAGAAVQYAESQAEVKKAADEMAKHPKGSVQWAKAHEKWTKARFNRQEAGKVLKPRKRKE